MDKSIQHWGVDVRVNGKQILTIESNCLYGKPQFSEAEEEVIRNAAQSLLAFIGKAKAPIARPAQAEGITRK